VSDSQGGAHSDAVSARFRHIGVCVDFSEAADGAFLLGQALRAEGSRLSVVTAVSAPLGQRMLQAMSLEGDPMEDARELVDSFSGRAPDVHPVVLRGRPGPHVVDWAAEHDVDLLVAAAHGGLAERLTMGSFTSHIAYHAPCAVAIARPDTGGDAPPSLNRIAACIDDSAAALEAAEVAAGLASEHGAELTLVHAVAGVGRIDPRYGVYYETIRSGAEQMIQHLASQYDATPVVVDGHPGSTITDWASENGTDLLVAAAHRDAPRRAVLGSFAGYLAHHAPCSVLLTRPPVPPDDDFMLA
jgi:nucleotide-binding universal stress UspA family protein